MMRIRDRGAVVMYLSLLAVTTLAWLSFADLDQVPALMFAYLYPYSYLLEGKVGRLIVLVAAFQGLVLGSFVLSLLVAEGRSVIANTLAGMLAIVWFLAVSYLLVIAHIH